MSYITFLTDSLFIVAPIFLRWARLLCTTRQVSAVAALGATKA